MFSRFVGWDIVPAKDQEKGNRPLLFSQLLQKGFYDALKRKMVRKEQENLDL